jgi:hypothetical protein
MTTKPDKLAVRQNRDRQIATLTRENEVDAGNALDAIAAAFTGATPLEEVLTVLTENVPLLTPDTAKYQFETVLQNLANAAAVATDTAKALRDRHAQADAQAAQGA